MKTPRIADEDFQPGDAVTYGESARMKIAVYREKGRVA
jgi:hypothetical protein